jgi:hypothetical protein
VGVLVTMLDALLFHIAGSRAQLRRRRGRTLVGEDDGLAVALTHWRLQWQTAGGMGMRV